MAATSSHRIRRLVWRVSTGSLERAWELRGRLAGPLGDELLPLVEQALDDLDRPERVLRLPRLELRLRLDHEDDLLERLGPALREGLDRALIEAGWHGPPSGATGSTEGVPVRGLAALPPGVSDRPLALELDRLLARYLAEGRLEPDAAPGGEPVGQALRAAARRRLDGLAGPPPSPVVSTPLQALRWLALLEPSEWSAGVIAIGRPASAQVPGDELADGARRLAEAVAAGSLSVDLALRSLAALLVADGRETVGRDALGRALERLPSDGSAALRQASVQALDQALDTPSGGGPRAPSSRVDGVSGWAEDRPTDASAAASVEDGPPLPAPAAGSVVDLPLGRPVGAAGLVLVHPHLPRLLAACDLDLTAARTGGDGDLRRAQALLWYLATGSEQALEPELELVAVLLGLEGASPGPVLPGQLTAGDRREADGLLAAVIAQWQALGSTSPRGLRETFLSRPGLLREQEGGWLLQVEPAAFDVLLARLPWGLGVVRPPWCSRPLFVEWEAR